MGTLSINQSTLKLAQILGSEHQKCNLYSHYSGSTLVIQFFLPPHSPYRRIKECACLCVCVGGGGICWVARTAPNRFIGTYVLALQYTVGVESASWIVASKTSTLQHLCFLTWLFRPAATTPQWWDRQMRAVEQCWAGALAAPPAAPSPQTGSRNSDPTT